MLKMHLIPLTDLLPFGTAVFSGLGAPGSFSTTYRGYTALVLQGMSKTDALLSKEGVMQGDPLSMLMYASSTLPLIKSLYNPSTLVQNWYADDSSCAAKLPHLLNGFKCYVELGPKYGYYPEPKKTILIV